MEYGVKISSSSRTKTGEEKYGIGCSIGGLPIFTNSISYGCLSINTESLESSAKPEKQILLPNKINYSEQSMRKSSASKKLENTRPIQMSVAPTAIEHGQHHLRSGGSVASSPAREMESIPRGELSIFESILCYMW